MPRRGAALIKVDQVPNFTAAALDHPVVAVEGRLVAKLLVRARLRGQLVRVPLEAQQPQLLQALWVERLPAQDLSPARRGRAMCAAPVGGVAGRRGRRTMCARSPRCGSPRPSACPPPSARSPSFASRCRTSGRTGTPTRHRRSWESSTRRGRCSAASAAPAPGAAPSTSCTAATKFAKVSAHKRIYLRLGIPIIHDDVSRWRPTARRSRACAATAASAARASPGPRAAGSPAPAPRATTRTRSARSAGSASARSPAP